jgi:DUF1680 family protein
MYCIEQADHAYTDVWDLALSADTPWTSGFEPEVLGGVVILRTTALGPATDIQSPALYFPHVVSAPAKRSTPLTAVPYYAWANREVGPMQVWISTAR